jgi:putative ABC transport system permease protein
VGVTVLAGLIPAWHASRITPLEALRPSLVEGEFNRGAGKGFIFGVVLLVLTAAAILSGQAALIVPGGVLFLVGLVLVAPALVRPFASLLRKVTAWATVRQGIGGLAAEQPDPPAGARGGDGFGQHARRWRSSSRRADWSPA